MVNKITFLTRWSPVGAAPAVLAILVGGLFVGCDVPPRPPLDPSDLNSSPVEVVLEDQKQEVLETPGESFDGRWETWDAYFVAGKPVGYSHVIAASVDQRAVGDVRYKLENRIFVHQGGARLRQVLIQNSTETFDGRLIGFDSVLQVGPAATRFEGSISGKKLEVETARGSARTVRSIPWQSTFRGLVAVEQSLRNRPMIHSGEKRNLKMLMPQTYQLVTARLRCAGKAAVSMMDGTMASLVEINSEMELEDGKTIYATIWTNDDGEIMRSFSPGMRLMGYRTDKATATTFPGNDSSVVSLVVKGDLDRPDEAQRLALKIAPTPAEKQLKQSFQFPAMPGQFVRSIEGGAFQVLISREVEHPGKGFVVSELVPIDEDQQPSYFVDSGATLVRRFADATIGSAEMSTEEVAMELTKTTHTLIGSKETTGFSRASEIARDGVGDSTEHAILLMALLRARGIPSRIVFGLKYVAGTTRDAGMTKNSSRMVYHAWTIAWINDQWVHLDATMGTHAAADRLILATSNLSGRKEYESLIPFLNLIGRLEIAIIGAKY